MRRELVVLTSDAQRLLRDLGGHGYFQAASDNGGLFYVTEITDRNKTVRYGSGVLLPAAHPMSHATDSTEGAFYRVPVEAHGLQLLATMRDASLTFHGLRSLVPELKLAQGGLVITYAPDHAAAGVPEFAAWVISKDAAQAVALDVEPDQLGIAALSDRWPTRAVQDSHVLLVGAGTIGTSTAVNLASYGVGRLTVVDPDRLRFHNLRRLDYQPAQVGRFKVDLLAERINHAWPDTTVDPRADNIVDGIDSYRRLAADANLIVCTADGVAARRVCSYLGRRAGTDVVLSCVLDDGGVAEVLRLRAGPAFGCLDCQRADLTARGVLDTRFTPEADLHAPYGDGFLHKPMTAVGGDLDLAGAVTAKIAVSTLLENSGHGEHVLPGDAAVVTLRGGDLVAPYGDPAALALTWEKAAPPRAECFICNPTPAAEGRP